MTAGRPCWDDAEVDKEVRFGVDFEFADEALSDEFCWVDWDVG
jgi:hypothetical protein